MPFFLFPILLIKKAYFKQNFHRIIIPLAIIHIITNIIFFAVNLGLKDTDEDKAKIKTHNIIHAAISWTVIASYFIFAGILGKELFVGRYSYSSITMIVHAIVNILPISVDPSISKIIYPIVSTLACGFITFCLGVSDKTWDGMASNAKKMKDKMSASTENPVAEKPPETKTETDTTATDTTATETAKEFGKRQRRRNPPKRRRRKNKY